MLRHLLAITLALLAASTALAQRPGDRADRMRERSRQIDARLADDPYVGIHASSGIERGLYTIESTGVSTEPVRKATEKFLAALTDEQRAKTMFPVDDDEWRKWMNQHFYVRQGVGFDEMNETQRDAAFGLMRASLSADGLKLSRDIMNLNRTLGELNDNNFAEYNEWLYWITVMGKPSADQPWGWQVDGHHLIINYFVLGDQVVMTPLFVGSEPVIAESGKYKGTVIMQREQDQGLALIRSLPAEQQVRAIIETSKDGNNNLGEAFSDNIVLDYAGIPASELSPHGRAQLLDLIGLYVHNMREGHARVRMAELEAHLDETHFAWIGGTDEDAVFYYRIHSPVILIEFDHQRPVGIRHLVEGRAPIRQHIHAVVRTPNGNDYGKDLLRRHYERDH
ncbi:MAG: DUF3500 domain-containing protein [Holophagales bacterium]|nr:DUF3500 domain-containing protein [Holophagales bacterium]MYD22983.1 DUF3500 domain-containing protein [Holophagales bacterium]MYI32444.1 DUF3500 domain-containing protein [Holophagales bacterium]